MDLGGSLDEIVGRAARDGAQSRAAAWADYHAAGDERAARHRGHVVLLVVIVKVIPKFQLFGIKAVEVDLELQLVLKNIAAGGADREMHIAARGLQDFEQADRVDRSASACDANDDGVHRSF